MLPLNPITAIHFASGDRQYHPLTVRKEEGLGTRILKTLVPKIQPVMPHVFQVEYPWEQTLFTNGLAEPILIYHVPTERSRQSYSWVA